MPILNPESFSSKLEKNVFFLQNVPNFGTFGSRGGFGSRVLNKKKNIYKMTIAFLYRTVFRTVDFPLKGMFVFGE